MLRYMSACANEIIWRCQQTGATRTRLNFLTLIMALPLSSSILLLILNSENYLVVFISLLSESKNYKRLQSFLGLTGYFRKFLPGYSIAKPLSDLLKKNVNFQFERKQQIAFNKLKQLLKSRYYKSIIQIIEQNFTLV